MTQHDVSVFAVHTTRPDEGAGAIEVIFTDERSARAYARSRSGDWRITSASVTRYTLGRLGTRHPVTWYQQGDEQDIRTARPDRATTRPITPAPFPTARRRLGQPPTMSPDDAPTATSTCRRRFGGSSIVVGRACPAPYDDAVTSRSHPATPAARRP